MIGAKKDKIYLSICNKYLKNDRITYDELIEGISLKDKKDPKFPLFRTLELKHEFDSYILNNNIKGKFSQEFLDIIGKITNARPKYVYHKNSQYKTLIKQIFKDITNEVKKLRNFYIDNGKLVFTGEFLLKRGVCCNNNCRHCPYGKNN